MSSVRILVRIVGLVFFFVFYLDWIGLGFRLGYRIFIFFIELVVEVGGIEVLVVDGVVGSFLLIFVRFLVVSFVEVRRIN